VNVDAFGGGIYAPAGAGSGPGIYNCNFIGNCGINGIPTYLFCDIYTDDNNNAKLRVHNSATISGSYFVPNTGTNISHSNIRFKNSNNLIGPDGRWFTNDDGGQLSVCSDGINRGDNSLNQYIGDMAGNNRVYGNKIDLGPYEFNGRPDYATIPVIKNDSVSANKEYTDAEGWTHYYNNCQYIMSVKKNQQLIGNVVDSSLKVVVKTLPSFGSGIGNNLSNASYVSPGVLWYSMNRYFTIQSSFALTDSMLIRFPFSKKDVEDLQGSLAFVDSIKRLMFFTVALPNKALDTTVPANSFFGFRYDSIATTTTWKQGIADSVSYAEFFIKQLGSGSGGVGTGAYNSPLSMSIDHILCDSNSVQTFVCATPSNSYQWQVNDGSGFVDVQNNGYYNGSGSSLLTINQVPSGWSQYLYRCKIDGGFFSSYHTLKSQNTWTGNVSTAWEDPANWSCGRIPDNTMDVIINQGTVNVSSNIVIRSLKIANGVNFTVSNGITITILR
jgi:hypothetical protein